MNETVHTLQAQPNARLRIVSYIGDTLYGWDGHGAYVFTTPKDARTVRQVKEALCYSREVEYTVPAT